MTGVQTCALPILRLHAVDAPGSLAQIADRFAEHRVSLAQVVQVSGGPDHPNGGTGAELVLVTHTVRDANLQAVVRDLKGMRDTVLRVDNVIRVEG